MKTTNTTGAEAWRHAAPHLLAAAVLALLPMGAAAEQYRSEVKELDQPPPATTQDPQQLLQNTKDPYARALLLRDLAAQAVSRKDYAAASRYLEQAIAQKSLSGFALEQMRKDLAQLYMAAGRYKDVLAELEPQVRRNPDAPPEQLVAVAAAYIELKRYREAVPLLERAVAKAQPPDESWLAALLLAYRESDQMKKALPLLEQLIRLSPGKREYWLQLAALQLQQGERQRALATLELAQRQGHLQSEDERMQLIALTAQLGAPFEAGSLMQVWMEGGQLPSKAGDWRTLAGLWTAARESGLAIDALSEALKQQPDGLSYLQLGQLHMDREEYEQAARALEQAIERGQRNANVLMTLGLAYYQQADLDAAVRAFRQAAEFPQQRELAQKWVDYLDNDSTRGQVMAALAKRKPRRRDDEVLLSPRLLGATVNVDAPVIVAPGAPRRGARDRATAAGGALTPVGAERSGNAAGTIPAWDGGLTRERWPRAFERGKRLVDPFGEDKPLFVITGENAAQYADKLTSGHRALLANYPTYRLPVYPSRRSAVYPEEIYEATQANKGKAKLIGSDALTGARLGFPFPEPTSGVEVMWNHRVRYRGDSVQAQSTQAVVNADGSISQQLQQTERVLYRYGNLKNPADLSVTNVLLYYLTWFSSGSTGRSVDFLALVHETANSMKDTRAIWVLPPGIRRLFRVPPVGYDQPFPGSEAIYFIDMLDMYNGAFDRYVWKLTGKRELYIPYNAYRISDGRYKYEQLLQKGHLNPAATRYELHRVWVIEATEREGKRHSFGKRVFYVDEDTWNVVLVENFDREGRLWRFQEGHLLVAYDVPYANCLPVVTYDFKDARYFINRLVGEDPVPRYNLKDIDEGDFTPATVKNRYAR